MRPSHVLKGQGLAQRWGVYGWEEAAICCSNMQFLGPFLSFCISSCIFFFLSSFLSSFFFCLLLQCHHFTWYMFWNNIFDSFTPTAIARTSTSCIASSKFVVLFITLLTSEPDSHLDTGMMVGGYIWGSLGDIYGRKNVLVVSLMVNAIAGIVSSFMQGFPLFFTMRFISGLGWVKEKYIFWKSLFRNILIYL